MRAVEKAEKSLLRESEWLKIPVFANAKSSGKIKTFLLFSEKAKKNTPRTFSSIYGLPQNHGAALLFRSPEKSVKL